MSDILKFPFGKYKGQAITNVPKEYLAWALANMAALTEEQRGAIRLLLDGYKAKRGGYQPYAFDAMKELMQIAFRQGMYSGKQDLLKITMQGAFEGWSGRSTETWEHRFFVEFRIPAGNFSSEHPEQVYSANGQTLEEACAKVLSQYQEARKEPKAA